MSSFGITMLDRVSLSSINKTRSRYFCSDSNLSVLTLMSSRISVVIDSLEVLDKVLWIASYRIFGSSLSTS